ncbi:uncharacterized protein LOC105849853 [Hydra vulgaris]|uniref:uncharacterized protein LOC105849853 n=1 Tax=Hydra vulgaris TaxID=6087 RepID=UPI001F5E77BB|nr:uncharacterized protein LOC105849853 [Hydra vulgaris]
MKFQHKLVPGHGSDHLVRTVGDLLTVERKQKAQDDLRDSSTPSTRLEGLVPCLGDFHTYGNFLEVIWHLLYHASSSQDIGTLFQARNFFNARSVSASLLKDINACEDFILKYSDAFLVTAFKHYFTVNNFDFSDQGNKCYNKLLMKKLLTDLVEGYITPDMSEDIFLCKGYKCSFCEKSYIRMKTLKMHIKNNNKNATLLPDKTEDFVLNYSKNALNLCFLVKDFINARKHGDGKRILRLHKFLLLYFKLDTKLYTKLDRTK